MGAGVVSIFFFLQYPSNSISLLRIFHGIIMQITIVLIFAVHYSWALLKEKTWNNYRETNLENWNNEISVNGLYFSTNLKDPMAFYSEETDTCHLVIPMDNDDNDTDSSWTPKSDNKQVACPIQEISNTYWIDPRNWNSVDTNPATPHLERLPCSDDRVIFKEKENLFVILPSKPIKIRRFVWNSRTLFQYNFKKTIQSEEFLKNFVVTGNKDVTDIIITTGSLCDNRMGCECGTISTFYEETCKLLRTNNECNQTLECKSTVKPIGHCCPICGAYLQILIDETNFVFKKLSAVVNNFFKIYKGYYFHLSKVSGNLVQIVVVKGNETTDVDVFAVTTLLSKKLKSDDMSHLGILNADIFSSESVSYKTVLWGPLASQISAAFAIASLVIITLLAYQSKISLEKLQSLFKSSLSFVKFENQFEKNEFEEKHQQEPNIENVEEIKEVESEEPNEERSENENAISEPDDDAVFVEIS